MNNLTNQTYQNQLQYMKQNVIIMGIIIFLLLIFTCWFYYLYKKIVGNAAIEVNKKLGDYRDETIEGYYEILIADTEDDINYLLS